MSQVLQSILLSLFFVMIARNYTTQVFANYIIATALYQLITAFSSLGLSQWFIREITVVDNKNDLINNFFKLQLYSGVTFYLINIILGYLLYDDELVHILSILLGINILFDNLINAIRCINISEFNQKKSFVILSTEAFLKFAATCFLFVYPFSIITLSIILVIVRFVTLNLFLNFGSTRLMNLKLLFQYKISLNYIKHLIALNWPFIIIGSVSIINWRISTIIISKALSSVDVANYEISYRVFSLASILPVIVSTSIFPILVKYFKEGKVKEFRTFYRKMHIYHLIFGLLSFTFIYSFVDFLLPIVFGLNYAGASSSTKEMFLTILVIPTVCLQANVLIAMKYEKLDMWFNVTSLIIFLTFCLIGVYFFKSLIIINISIFIGFLFFHILQDLLLIKKNVSSIRFVLKFYTFSILSIFSYILLTKLLNPIVLFLGFWVAIFCFYFLLTKFRGVFKIKVFA